MAGPNLNFLLPPAQVTRRKSEAVSNIKPQSKLESS